MRKRKYMRLDWLGMSALIVVIAFIVIGILAPIIAPHQPNAINLSSKLQMPNKEFLLGTDQLGRCILSRLIFGVRTTFFYAAISMAATIFLGTLLGVIAGYSRGVAKELILRFCDIMLSIPSEVMILAIVGVLGPGLLNIILANTLTKWAWYTRMISSTVQKFQNYNYVKFAQLNSGSHFYVLKTHIVPGIAPEVITHASLEMGWVILSISSLSFLGLGVQPPISEWGMMLNEAKDVMFTHPWQMMPSGITILIAICSLNLLGDSLQHAISNDNTAIQKVSIDKREEKLYGFIKR